jgi:VCBS repeat-containing protein
VLIQNIEDRATRGILMSQSWKYVACLFVIALCSLSPASAQIAPSDEAASQQDSGIVKTVAVDGRQDLDNSQLRILYVSPWATSGGNENLTIVLGVADGASWNQVKFYASADDVIENADWPLQLADASVVGDDPRVFEVNPQNGIQIEGTDWKKYTLQIQANRLLQIGRGTAVIGAVAQGGDIPQDPLAATGDVIADVKTVCVQIDQPVDLRIVDDDGDIEPVVSIGADFDIDVNNPVVDGQEDRFFATPRLGGDDPTTVDQCSGDRSDLEFSVNQVNADSDLRCSVGSVGFDVWFVEGVDSSIATRDQIARRIHEEKRLRGDSSDFATDVALEPTNTRFFQLHTSVMTKDIGQNSLSSLDDSQKLELEDGEIGDPIYGVWGYWGANPIAKRQLYNMVALAQRSGDKGLELAIDNALETDGSMSGGQVVLYAYDPAWYGLAWFDELGWVRVVDDVSGEGSAGMESDLANNVVVLDGDGMEIPSYSMTVEAADLGSNPLQAGASVELELRITNRGSCDENPLLAVISYEDLDNDVNPTNNPANGIDVDPEHHARLLNVIDANHAGIVEIQPIAPGDERAVPIHGLLPSSVVGPGTLHVWLVPADQIGMYTVRDDLQMPVASAVRIFDSWSTELELNAIADVGFTQVDADFPWPNPFFQKHSREYTLSDLLLVNHGALDAPTTVRVELCGAGGCGAGSRELMSYDIDVPATGSVQQDYEFVLPSDLRVEEQLVRVRIDLNDNATDANAPIKEQEKPLVAPYENYGLRGPLQPMGAGGGYTVFVAPGEEFSIGVTGAEGGPGFTVPADGVSIDPPDAGLEFVALELPDAVDANGIQTADLTFRVAEDLVADQNHVFDIRLATDDVWGDPYEATFRLALQVPAEAAADWPETAAVVTDVRRTPAYDAMMTERLQTATRAWFFNPGDEPTTLMVDYVTTPDGTAVDDGNVFNEPTDSVTIRRRLELESRGTPDSLQLSEGLLEEVFGFVTPTRGWLLVHPPEQKSAGTGWPEGVPLVAASLEETDPSRVLAPAEVEQFLASIPSDRVFGDETEANVVFFVEDTRGASPAWPEAPNQQIVVSNLGDAPLQLTAQRYRHDGVRAGLETLDLGPHQVATFDLDTHVPRVALRATSQDSRWYASGRQIDAASGDSMMLPAMTDGADQAEQLLIPVVETAGPDCGAVSGTPCRRSDLMVANTSGIPARFRLGAAPPVTVAAGETLALADIGAQSTGGLATLTVESGEGLIAAARLASEWDCGTEDQPVACDVAGSVPVLADDDLLAVGGDAGLLFSLDLNDWLHTDPEADPPQPEQRFADHLVLDGGSDPSRAVLRLLGRDGQSLVLLDAAGAETASSVQFVEIDAGESRRFEGFDRLECAEDDRCVGAFFAAPLLPMSEGEQFERLRGATLEVAMEQGNAAAVLVKEAVVGSDVLVIPALRPQGYGGAVPTSNSNLDVGVDASEVGAWVTATVTLKDATDRPLAGYEVGIASSRFEVSPAGTSYPWLRFGGDGEGVATKTASTDENGVAVFQITAHSAGAATYHAYYLPPGSAEKIELQEVEDSCDWFFDQEKAQISTPAAPTVGQTPQLTVTLKEADGTEAWPGNAVVLKSDRPEDTPDDDGWETTETDDGGVATFTVGSSTIGTSSWTAQVRNTDGGEEFTLEDASEWQLQSISFSHVDQADAGSPNGDDCGNQGDEIAITVTVEGVNGAPVVNANVVLDSPGNADDSIDDPSQLTDANGEATYRVRVDSPVLDIPAGITYVATVTPNSGADLTAPEDDDSTRVDWLDNGPPEVSIQGWSETFGPSAIINEDAILDFSARDCVGTVDGLLAELTRSDAFSFGEQSGGAVTGGVPGPGSPANTWTSDHTWGVQAVTTPVLDLNARREWENFDITWEITATDVGNNTDNASITATVDALAPTLVAATVTTDGAGPGGLAPVAGSGFYLWSDWREYFPQATGVNRYRLQTAGAGTQDLQAPASTSGTGEVTLASAQVTTPLGGDQAFVSMTADLADIAGHLTQGSLDQGVGMAYVKPLPAANLVQTRPQTIGTGATCAALTLGAVLAQNGGDPATGPGRTELQYGFVLDVTGNGFTGDDLWLHDTAGPDGLRWSAVTGPEYRNAAGWGLFDWGDEFFLPVRDDNGVDVFLTTEDHTVLVFAHNPTDPDQPAPGADANSVSEVLVVPFEGLPTGAINLTDAIILTDVLDLDVGDTIHGVYSDDDTVVSRVEILISSPGGFYDAANGSWVGGEIWNTVTLDAPAQGQWTFGPVPSNWLCYADPETEADITLRIRVVDDETDQAGGEVLSCNEHEVTINLVNEAPTVTIGSDNSALMVDGAISGTLSDRETNECDTDRVPTVELQIWDTTTDEYWDGAVWIGSEASFTVDETWTADFSEATWSYPIEALIGGHRGDNLEITARVVDDHGDEGNYSDSAAGFLNDTPIANADGYFTTEDEDFEVSQPGVLSNDQDDRLSDLVVSQWTYDSTANSPGSSIVIGIAALTVNADGSVSLAVNDEWQDLAAGESEVITFEYLVQDFHGEPSESPAVVTITINGVNDAPTVTAATFSVDENLGNGTVVGTVDATDVDSTVDAFAITAGNGSGAGAFAIDSSGEITVNDSTQLDYETTPSFSLTVEATDSDSATGSNTITIDLINVNEPPTVTAATFSVDENSGNGTVVGTVVATDVDSTVDAFAITAGNGSGAGAFAIDSSGEITVNDSTQLDYETTPSFSLTVEATDSDSATGSNTITINLNDVNDAPTVTAATFSVDENSGNGTVVGTVVATDVDSTVDAFAITAGNGSGAGAFAIDSSGQVMVNDSAQLDYETTPSFSLTVEATDDDLATGSNTITINLNDVNDAPTVAAATFSVDENSVNGTVVGTVVATDVDGTVDDFAITAGNGSGAGAFAIDSSGQVTVNDSAQLDYETTPSFSLTVAATDSDSATGSNTITINLNDVNDAPLAVDDGFSTGQDTPLIELVPGVLGNDTDDDGDSLVVSRVEGGAGNVGTLVTLTNGGTVTVQSDGSFEFTPAPSFTGDETFTYVASDGTLESGTAATVTITVGAKKANRQVGSIQGQD